MQTRRPSGQNPRAAEAPDNQLDERRTDDPTVPKYHKPDEHGLTGYGATQGGSGSSFYPSGEESDAKSGQHSSANPASRSPEDGLLKQAQRGAESNDESSGDAETSSAQDPSKRTH
ncbi:MAG: hypothetical protein ACJ8MR_08285 [Povalibacter sp.]